MVKVAKLFTNGRCQAVRLPAEFRMPGNEVYIERQGDAIVLRPKPEGWDDFFTRPPAVPEDFLADVEDFASRLAVLPWDRAAAEVYGELRAELERQGAPIGAMDLMIAAHARSLDAVLVSHNTRHSQRVPHLKLADWV